MIPHEHVYDFLLAGRCEVTFHNTSTGNQFKAHINGYPSRKISKSNLPFTGWTVRNAGFRKLGYIRGDVFIPEGEITEDTRRFKWVWNHIVNKTIPPELEVMHHGRCSYCNRPLTDAESIKVGIGPVCRSKLAFGEILYAKSSPATIEEPVEPAEPEGMWDGIQELPITPHVTADSYTWDEVFKDF